MLRAKPALHLWVVATRTWAELARLAPQICRMAGISEDARRRRVVDQMGEQAAAIAIAITLQKFDERQENSPGGYLRAMTERAAAGELHLARSVSGLAARYGMEGIRISALQWCARVRLKRRCATCHQTTASTLPNMGMPRTKHANVCLEYGRRT